MFTEQEAREKWCPMARVDFRSFNHVTGGDETFVGNRAAPCIASQCMMWRWRDPKENKELKKQNAMHVAQGFCGLASRPEVA